MTLSVGIVGLPNVGKSTTFNALTKEQHADAANYPFCTIEPNKAIVPLPDDRLAELAKLVSPEKILPAIVEFVDIAGLVAGASKGEGLGNQFLGNIRETSAIVHVVRCFDDPNVVHVDGAPDPARDVDTITTELILADLEQVERKCERLQKQVKGDKKYQLQLEEAQRLGAHLGDGAPASTYSPSDENAYVEIVSELRPITAKPVIFAANVDEAGLADDSPYVATLRDIAKRGGHELVILCAKLEEEMAGLSDEERAEFLEASGVSESGLDQVVRCAYSALGLISYFTAGPKEVRAWTICDGWTAPQAAGVIHTDFERGFIRAEVIAYAEYIALGGESGAKTAGKMASEGREYIVRDGDVIHFRFNV